MNRTQVLSCTLLWLGCAATAPAHALDRSQLAVIVNTRDPLSVAIGEYYAAKRSLSFQNIIKVEFNPGGANLGAREFEVIKAAVERQTRPAVQAYALTWAAPYRVDCMSITAAFAFGFDPAYCAEGCKTTQTSPLFNSPSRLPFTQHGVRPTMALAARSIDEARALIDRGVEADSSMAVGSAYLLSTSDAARNVRHVLYPAFEAAFRNRINVLQLKQDSLHNVKDVLFYFTGRAQVEGLEALGFVPGAVAAG